MWFRPNFRAEAFEGFELDNFMDSLSVRGKKLCLSHFQTGDLIEKVQSAIDKVIIEPELIEHEPTREVFLAQNAKKTAKSLCTTVVRWIYLKLNDCDVPSFEDYWIDLVNKGVYLLYRKGRSDRKEFNYYRNEHLLIKDYLDTSTYFELKKNSKIKSKVVQDLIQSSGVQVCMFRNFINSHTFAGVIEGNDIIRLDTFKKNKLGIKMKGKYRWLYGYRDGVNA